MQQVCPNCGDFTEGLREDTGWCDSCSPSGCSRCGKEFKKDQNARDKCPTCRHKEWLEKNADMLEVHLATGITLGEAIEKVRGNQYECLNCGDSIPKGMFCTKPECKKKLSRYKRNRWAKNMTKEDALREALAA